MRRVIRVLRARVLRARVLKEKNVLMMNDSIFMLYPPNAEDLPLRLSNVHPHPRPQSVESNGSTEDRCLRRHFSCLASNEA